MSQAKAIERRAFLKALAGAGVLTTLGYGAAVIGGSRAPVNVPGSETDPLAILKSPSTDQAIRPTGPTIPLQIVSGTGGDSRALLLRSILNGTSGFDFDPLGRLMSLVGVPTNVAGLSPIFRVADTIGQTFDFLSIDRFNLLGLIGAAPGIGMTTIFQADDPAIPPGNFNVQSTTGVGVLSNIVGPGAQVGLPTPSVGTLPGKMVFDGHRHPFSGRFSLDGFFANALGTVPTKFQRFTIANNWTLRRISAFAQTAPAGGSDTFGVVNAAGTLQGTAVTLAAGAQEADSGLQVTNLVGGTTYYLAETATTAVTQAVGINVSIEYTMNV
jgi:hypothetical protein